VIPSALPGALRRVRGAVRRSPAPAPAPAAPIYLINTCGWPNYGDELITRGWLRHLAEHRPDVEVWVDCPQPGRAAFLFRDDHPRLKTTNTLWQLVDAAREHPEEARHRFVEEKIVGLGTPRIDLGLEALRGMGSLHLLGGGYLNDIWPDQRLLVEAIAVLKRRFGVPAYATGGGFLPTASPDVAARLADTLAEFDFAESRDQEGADLLGVPLGLDDAFLALAPPRTVYDERDDLPTAMIMIQGDFVAPELDGAIVRQIASFVDEYGAGRDDVGFVEAVPLEDLRFRELCNDVLPKARFYTFVDLWRGGFPAAERQVWMSTRFHMHLVAAAAGAAGTALSVLPGFYDVKHDSLLQRGTGWSLSALGADGVQPPTRNPEFRGLAEGYRDEKVRLAERLYPA
jgi:hypothetical protein